jgi:hypothetical protein
MDTDQLSRRVRFLTWYSAFLTIAVALLIVSRRGSDIVRARGIVIEDASGRARILIGAPIPVVSERVRTDTARAHVSWGDLSPKYMSYYQGYRHRMTGMLVLNSAGFDRVALGDSVPDPNIGPRISAATGLVVNDSNGFERLGLSLIASHGKQRSVLGLDTRRGEGIILSVADSGWGGLTLNTPDTGTSVFIGQAFANDSVDGRGEPFLGELFKWAGKIGHERNVANRTTSSR